MDDRFKHLRALAAPEPPMSIEEAVALLDPLPEHPAIEEVRAVLNRFRDALTPMDDTSRELAREGALRKLRLLGFRSAGRILETAMPAGKTRGERPTGLQEPDLWPEAVDGAVILTSLEQTLRRFVAVTQEQSALMALWTLFAHAHDAFEISPILAITSPDKGCGKSTALALLSALVPKPLTSANITPSAVFRVADTYQPTLLLDEADTFISDSEGLRGILNSGHMRSQAYVTRVTGDDHHVCMFSTWAPKAIALIGELPPTLADRSVTIRMRRRSHGEPIERLQLHRLGDMEDLRSMAARWAGDHVEDLRFVDPPIPGAITRDRARDNWRPLLAVADLAGGEWPARARASALTLTATSGNDTSMGIALLEDLRALFLARGNAKVVSEDILGHLHAMEERPWPEWRDRGPLTARQLAGILHPFGITPSKWRQDEVTRRGYDPSQFTDVFSRYLPPVPPHTPQVSFQSTCDPNLSATNQPLADPLCGDNSSLFTGVADVADAIPGVAPRKDLT